MIDIAGALTGPVAKLLLKSWIGDTATEIGGDIPGARPSEMDGREQGEPGEDASRPRRDVAWAYCGFMPLTLPYA